MLFCNKNMDYSSYINYRVIRWMLIAIILAVYVYGARLRSEQRERRDINNSNAPFPTATQPSDVDHMHAHIDDIIPMEDGFEPDVKEDFPTIPDATDGKIPHIMHQLYMRVNSKANARQTHSIVIPRKYEKSVASFFTQHTSWTYYFWDAWSARELVKKEFPELLYAYDNYDKTISRNHAFRYLLLYKFGGVYADIDVTFLRPLDRVTVKYPCVLVTMPFAQSSLETKDLPYRLNNNLMFCTPGHPFLKLLINNLAHGRMNTNIMDQAGQGLLTSTFAMYSNIYGNELFHAYKREYRDNVTPYFYKGPLTPNDEGYVYVGNTQYFTSPNWNRYRPICNEVLESSVKQRMCVYLKERNFTSNINSYIFTDFGDLNKFGYESSTITLKIGHPNNNKILLGTLQ